MNWRLRSTSRLATATTVELPVLRMAFQFLRAICAVLRMPQRSLVFVMVPDTDEHERDLKSTFATRDLSRVEPLNRSSRRKVRGDRNQQPARVKQRAHPSHRTPPRANTTAPLR